MYYVNHNACPSLEAAEEVALLYRASGVSVEILTEDEYFLTLNGKHSQDTSHIYL
jgi:hypothetical protein